MANVSTGPRSEASQRDTAGPDSTSRAPPATACATHPISGTPPVSPATAATRAGAEPAKCGEANSTANEGGCAPSVARASATAWRAAAPASEVRTSDPAAFTWPGYLGPGRRGSGNAARSAYQAWTIDVPCTLMLTAGSGDVAGPLTTAPVVMLNRLPWHGQLIVPPDTLPTVHPACVHTALNPWNSPDFGWVSTIFWAARILPPPTGMSEVLASAAGAAAPPEPEPAGAAGEEAGWLPATPPLLELYVLQPASTAAHAVPTQASTV